MHVIGSIDSVRLQISGAKGPNPCMPKSSHLTFLSSPHFVFPPSHLLTNFQWAAWLPEGKGRVT
eukprot:1000351-Pelagomonas_calceolata.AAC.1